MAAPTQTRTPSADAVPPVWTLRARVIATGLRGAQGIRQVGRFHRGGPLTSNPEFLMQTQPGRVLDPERVLVALDDNLGAAPGVAAHRAGTVLSIDPGIDGRNSALAVPTDLATRRQTPGAALQIYSAQSQRHLNQQHNSGARTAAFAGVSGPRYLSINNAFGRPWVANAPFGMQGAGSESVLDPDGAPLANAPSDVAGGVFVGAMTSRTSVPKAVRSGWFASLWNRRDATQLTPGAIDRGAFGTALLGASPDGSGFAVFAIVTGTGAIVQAHVQDGIDGLAPAGTIDVGGEDPGVIGIAFKWIPQRVLYVADARRDRIAMLDLGDDTRHFTLDGVRHLGSPWFHHPVDLAAAVPEIANPRFASHTTLAGGSDLYVANRGDGALLRMRQDGTVLARAIIELPDGTRLGADRLRSIAVASDAQRLWVIAGRPGSDESALLELAAFDRAGVLQGVPPSTTVPGVEARADVRAQGKRLFATQFTARSGLGPLFNASSCLACHPGPGGASVNEDHFARRVARMDVRTGRLLQIDGQTSALAPRKIVADRDDRSAASEAALPRTANVVSLRMPLTLFAASQLDEIPDAVIEAQAVSKGDGIKGRVHYVAAADGTRRVGRYGWKADIATLDEMVAEAFGNEMGITSALAVHPRFPVKDDGAMARSVATYLRELPRHQPTAIVAHESTRR